MEDVISELDLPEFRLKDIDLVTDEDFINALKFLYEGVDTKVGDELNNK